MTLEDLQKIPVLQTATINETAGKDPETMHYIITCLRSFWSGNYGTVCDDDTAANNSDLAEGCGHVLARYPQKYKLIDDIYIEAHFDADNLDNIDYTNTLIMYPDER